MAKSSRARSLRKRAVDDQVRELVCAALRELGEDRARFSVKVGNGVVSLMGEVPSGTYLGHVADVVRSIPHVKQLQARIKVV
jgi:osmotically-inducible protein OsmY